jgi:hypothetical protein
MTKKRGRPAFFKQSGRAVTVRVPIDLYNRAVIVSKKGVYKIPIAQLLVRGFELAVIEGEKKK